MAKWYEQEESQNGIIISCRIRLARNIKGFPYSLKLGDNEAGKMIALVKSAVLREVNPIDASLHYIQINALGTAEKLSLMESHKISPILLQKKQECGVIINDSETINIMLNEEDHIRIQSILPGDNMDRAWEIADSVDNMIEREVEYDFSERYGYLTACPTNVGTGLRASFMMHLPVLEKTGQIKNVIQAISKFGITVRGIYGEGSESMGAIYQISNQMTLGQSEQEIICNLKNVASLIMEQEKTLRSNLLRERRLDFEDTVYRSLGILKTARKISVKEAMEYLSSVRLGIQLSILEESLREKNIYKIMMRIQPGNLQSLFDSGFSPEKGEEIRAEFIREQFN